VIKTVMVCDRCGKSPCEFDTIFLKMDRRMDAAGSSEDIHESIDLCQACAHVLLRQLVTKDMDDEQRKKWVEWAKTKSPVVRA
jgi:hypothetical protein